MITLAMTTTMITIVIIIIIIVVIVIILFIPFFLHNNARIECDCQPTKPASLPLNRSLCVAGPMGPEGQYLPAEMLPVPASSPEPNMPHMSHMDGPHPFGNPPISRALPSAFTQTLSHGPPEMAVGDNW